MEKETLNELIAQELEANEVNPLDFIRVILQEVADEVHPGSEPEDLIDHFMLKLSEE